MGRLTLPPPRPKEILHPSTLPYLLSPGPEANSQEQGSQHLQEQSKKLRAGAP